MFVEGKGIAARKERSPRLVIRPQFSRGRLLVEEGGENTSTITPPITPINPTAFVHLFFSNGWLTMVFAS